MKVARGIGLALFALMALLAIGMPSSAMAYEYAQPQTQQPYHHYHHHHHWWQHHDQYDNGHNYDNRRYGYNGGLGVQNVPPNGEGMINGKNPNLIWACDSGGHHCHWAPRN